MKLYVFGTGCYYDRFVKYICPHDIIALLDNDIQKHNLWKNGKKIIAPEKANFEMCDFVVVLAYDYKHIYEQLIDLKVQKKKILHYRDIGKKLNLNIKIEFAGKSFLPSEILKQEKNVFICVHEFTRTGVPVAAMNTAQLLKNMGFGVIVGALVDGRLSCELSDKQLPYIQNLEIFSADQWRSFIKEFDFVLLGTVCVSEFGNAIAHMGIPIVWWIHESEEELFMRYPLPGNLQNIYYFAGGERVYRAFSKFYPDEKIRELLYFLPNSQNRKKNVTKKSKFVIAMVASFGWRKAQDIFINAVEAIPVSLRENVEFVIAGNMRESQYDIDWEQKEKEIPQLTLSGELSQSELENFFEKIDVLVCPSRDDPMPIVVTQAMQNGILSIVSTQVGQAKYIHNMENGIIVEAENVGELADAMTYCINNKDVAYQMGKASEKIFEDYFSEGKMRKNLYKIMEAIL